MRQVHAERRSRYATAIEQLADEKAPIRLGGVYTLVKLVDEWLADEKTLPNEEERREEGQAIINSLCAYIRSPFDLASKTIVLSQDQIPENYEGGVQQFVKDQARFREEKELRLTILDAIKTRLNDGIITEEDGNKKLLKGPWSDFDYDFSNTIFFYSIDFRNSYFNASSNFIQTTFIQRTDFREASFTKGADFSGAEFTGYAKFTGAEFTEANFSGAEFTGAKFTKGTDFYWSVDFSEAKLTEADFFEAEFTGYAKFTGAEFTGYAKFTGAKFTEAAFTGAKFTGAKFTEADFTGAKFTQNADFTWTEFTGYANFTGAEFTQNANFTGAKFTGAEFTWTEFTGYADFSETTFQSKPIFTLDNLDNKARFSCKAAPEDYKFKVSSESLYKIETEEQEYNGVKFIIPKGTELFDPDDPSS
ncbi:pentapeptide repeat-containing protein [Rothia aeria]|uniref:pentapeptide repeat-containing protein n=1 Tax=Rothia aeria TaxID=172042 RepID=UPI00103A500F|nr:pentapeptide repeat-containing protein [Rothia aeria]